jgi:hypothetical protein
MIAATFDPIVARYILNKPEKAFPFFACAPSGAESFDAAGFRCRRRNCWNRVGLGALAECEFRWML